MRAGDGPRRGQQAGVENGHRQHRDTASGARGQQAAEGAVVEQRVTAGQHHHVNAGLADEPGQLGSVVHARADGARHPLRAQLGERGIAVAQRSLEMVLRVVPAG